MYFTVTASDPRGLRCLPFVNSSGSKEMAVDGSSTAVPFVVRPAAGETLVVRGIKLVGRAASGAIGHDKFVGIAALSNGLVLQLVRGNTAFALHAPDPANPDQSLFPIKSNIDFELYAQAEVSSYTTDVIQVFWDFWRNGISLRLVGPKAGQDQRDLESLRFLVKDNLTTVVGLSAMLLGHVEIG